MQDFKELICPNCQGSDFAVIDDICTCKYCLSKFTKKQIDSKMFVDLRQANNERNFANFDKAKKIYKSIINNYPNEDLSDAYWGQFLCEQRVLFEEDGKGEKFPSFYRMNLNEESSVDDSPSFAKALSYALKNNRDRLEVFNTLANKIDNARKIYFDIQSKTKPFDLFICFKNSDEKGNHTPDRELAMDIYNELSAKYNIFFSEKTLKNIKSNYREYEPNIYYGLYTAKVMLLICSKKEYLESQWLKNEWSRFTQINRQGGEDKCIIPIFTDNFNPNDLPDELWHTQGIFDDRKLMTILENTLENILHPVDKLEELKKQQVEELKKQEEELKKQREELLKQQEKYILFENFIREQQEKEEKRNLEEKQKEKNENQKLNQEKERLELEKQKIELERKNFELEKQKELEKQNNLLEELDKRLKIAPTQSVSSEQIDTNAPKLNFDESLATFGTYNEKKITWRVLEKKGNIIKLIADKILDTKPFNISKAENKFAQSSIYMWLNNDFYNKAFTDDEKLYILNSKNSDAEGKVLLLDGLECKKISFGDRKRTFQVQTIKPCWWWLSSPSLKYSGYPMIINENGYQTEIRSTNINGVVPVITVSLELPKN